MYTITNEKLIIAGIIVIIIIVVIIMVMMFILYDRFEKTDHMLISSATDIKNTVISTSGYINSALKKYEPMLNYAENLACSSINPTPPFCNKG